MSEPGKSEIELKLVLSGREAESAVVEYVRGHHYTVEELEPVRNVDTYLDTFDWSLMKNKLSLRYRISNGSWMYTLKSIGPIEDGIARRMETEIPLDKPVDDPTRIPVKQIRKRVDDVIFPRRLLEQIQIRTSRRRYRVISPEEAEIELVFDTSTFALRGLQKPRRVQKLEELEAEILNGSEGALQSLSGLLSDHFRYLPAKASKFEVAIQRFKITIPSKKPPDGLRPHLDDRLDLAVRKILTYQFQRFREQLPGVQRDIDTEFVHQARVATRRMRSALRLFREAIPESASTYLGEELKWLGGMFGAVRDLDVFLLNLSRFKKQIENFPAKKKKTFEDWIEKRRRAPWKALCQALESPRYRNFERRFDQFLERPLPVRPRPSLSLKPVREVAPVMITEKFDAVIEQGRALRADSKLKQYHLLRIQMKRLRYASEFMATAYEGALDGMIERMVEIQDCLGELQDTVFTRKFIDGLLEDWKGKLVDPDLLFILGEIYQLQSEIARERRETFGRIWNQFSSEETMTLLKKILV
ncbi:MAG TPA: CHAD domain-containing protein [Thermodesulfobacteriota bacterium]|nr:CHAD domain-containing protein [Thermodesulfobacteriota bacterium]